MRLWGCQLSRICSPNREWCASAPLPNPCCYDRLISKFWGPNADHMAVIQTITYSASFAYNGVPTDDISYSFFAVLSLLYETWAESSSRQNFWLHTYQHYKCKKARTQVYFLFRKRVSTESKSCYDAKLDTRYQINMMYVSNPRCAEIYYHPSVLSDSRNFYYPERQIRQNRT
jgi:hypothetical protein